MSKKNSHDELQEAITSIKSLKLNLSESEKAFFANKGEGDHLKFLVNNYYASLATDQIDDPIRRQFLPTVEELDIKKVELTDPLGEKQYSPLPRLIHRYRDRVLLLVTDRCAMYCRHCFRRSFTGHEYKTVSKDQLDNICSYLIKHNEVNEILLSGGDPLTLSNENLSEILQAIRRSRPEMVIRIASRIPVVLPKRVNDELVSILRENGPIWLITQFNHGNEISHESKQAVKMLIDSGIPIVNQSVLLKGVNDSVGALETLFQSLVRLRIKPYYLFQGDLAAGTSHFRVPIKRGLQLMKELRMRISGLALPIYTVDLPGGGGKVPLTESYMDREDEDNYYFTNSDGETYSYPKETE